MAVPNAVSGTLTILALVGFGVFLYPWLLGRRGGAFAVGALTLGSIVLFYLFDARSGVQATTSALLALVWGLLPLGMALLVRYVIKRKGVTR